jgi:hypothetical protein
MYKYSFIVDTCISVHCTTFPDKVVSHLAWLCASISVCGRV